jgi:hypothetical protein
MNWELWGAMLFCRRAEIHDSSHDSSHHMTVQTPPIYFYLPEIYWQVDPQFPHRLEQYFAQAVDLGELWEQHVAMQPSLKADGLFAWVILPYLHLRACGFPCQLVSQLPMEGIVILPRKFIPEDLRPDRNLLFVMLKADCKLHKYAQIHIIENAAETLSQTETHLWASHFIPHFPQPGLRPRDPQRGDRFVNVAYFGLETNLAAELCTPNWQAELHSLGFNWSIVSRDRWHDYQNIDALVAVRSFQQQGYEWKPASKLFNAWHAGIPALLGQETAFQAERKSELDYIEVNSPGAIITALTRLRDDVKLRHAMVDNGRQRAACTQPSVIAAQWQQFLTEVAIPAYHRWRDRPLIHQQSFILIRYLASESRGLRSQTRRIKGQVKTLITALT